MPTAAPVNAASQIGVSITRCSPNSSCSPVSRAKRATAATDVLAQHEHAVVVAERRAQSEPDGLDVGDGVAHSANTLAARPSGSG